jgi:hypothetical protein
MSQSGSGKPDPDFEGVELLFYQKGESASFGAKMALSLNGVDPGACIIKHYGSVLYGKMPDLRKFLKSQYHKKNLP